MREFLGLRRDLGYVKKLYYFNIRNSLDSFDGMKSMVDRRAVTSGLASLASLAVGTTGHGSTSNPNSRGKRSVADNRPNMIVFITDDQRADTVNTENFFFDLPNINKLARENIDFKQAYVTTSICPVSRASIWTGSHAELHGHTGWLRKIKRYYFSRNLFYRLSAAGYRLGFLGKYGLANPVPTPIFDVYGGVEGQGKYYDEQDPTLHLTRRLTNYAKQSIKKFSEQDDKPWILFICYKAPHGSAGKFYRELPDPKRKYPKWDQAAYEEYINTLAPHVESLPDYIQNTNSTAALGRWEANEGGIGLFWNTMRKLMLGVDASVGQILNVLREKGIYDETEIIFSSDNGHLIGEHGLVGKFLFYEPSIKVPLIWKPARSAKIDMDKAKKNAAETLALNIDIAPTVLKSAQLDQDYMQGTSLHEQVSGEHIRKEFFYSFLMGNPTVAPRCIGYRDGNLKVNFFPDAKEGQMFNLADDPNELNNLYNIEKYRGLRQTMMKKLKVARERTVDPGKINSYTS